MDNVGLTAYPKAWRVLGAGDEVAFTNTEAAKRDAYRSATASMRLQWCLEWVFLILLALPIVRMW